MQIPFKLFNSSSFYDEWLYCWDEKEKEKWMREKSEISYKENTFKTDRFHDLFVPIYEWIANDVPTGIICGIKANESPARRVTLTTQSAYKNITWSVKAGKHFRFSPLYDWSNEDIWVAIAKNDWKYNTFYDQLFKYGVPMNNMRVSSVIHETSAEWWLTKIQEIEPYTYEKLQKRLGGVNTYSILGKDIRMHKLPSMFSSWEKYCNHLITHIIPPNKVKNFERFMNNKELQKIIETLPEKKILFYRAVCQAILSNDFEGTKFDNIRNSLTLKYHKKTGESNFKYEKK
jgi:predicted phosphoadenosine phosphosulfate sulfurtransferase